MAAYGFEMEMELANRKNKLAVRVVASICYNMFKDMSINNYRIEVLNGKLQLRQSSTMDVSYAEQQRLKQKVEAILIPLKKAELLDYDKMRTQLNHRDIYVFQIKDIDSTKLLTKLGLDRQVEQSSSTDVEPAVWNAIPAKVRSRWSRFSPDMQQHIIKCVTPDAQNAFTGLLTTAIFTDSVRDPIMAAVPKIPVRFPANQADQFMDLTDVFNIQYNRAQRKRLDPFNNQPFELDQLIPATDKLERIEEIRAGARQLSS